MGLLKRGGLGGQQRDEGTEGAAGAVSQCSGGGWHQPPPGLGLEVVCTGLGAALGGGAGGVVGGARDCEGAGAAAGAAGLWRWRRCRCTVGLGLGEGEGEGDALAAGAGLAVGAGWPVTVAAGAVRANTTAKPTVAM